MPRIRLPRFERFMPPVCVITGATEDVVYRDVLVDEGKIRFLPASHSPLVLGARIALNAAYGRDAVHVSLPFTEEAYRQTQLSANLVAATVRVAALVAIFGLIAVNELVRNPMPWAFPVLLVAAAIPGLTYLARRSRMVEVVDGEGPYVELAIPSAAAAEALEAAWAEREETRRRRRQLRGA
jgi:hypothetical protein